MYYVADSHIKSNFYTRNRRMSRTDGVFPTATMKLHQRVVGWHRKKHIPVRDADRPSSLSAYLIDPKYLENGEVTMPKELPSIDTRASIPVYQYSRITRDAAPANTGYSSPLTQAATHIFSLLGVAASAFGTEFMARYHALTTIKPSTRYAVDSGVAPWWKQRLKFLSAAVLTGGLLVAAVALDNSNSTKPAPVSANPDSSQAATTSSNASTRSSIVPGGDAAAGQPDPASSQAAPAMISSPTKLRYQSAITTTTTQTTTTTPSVTTPSTTVPSVTAEPSPTTTPTPSPILDPVLNPVVDPVTNLINDTVLPAQDTVTAPVDDLVQ